MKFILIFQHIENTSCGKCIWICRVCIPFTCFIEHLLACRTVAFYMHEYERSERGAHTCDWRTYSIFAGDSDRRRIYEFALIFLFPFIHISMRSNIDRSSIQCGQFPARDDGINGILKYMRHNTECHLVGSDVIHWHRGACCKIHTRMQQKRRVNRNPNLLFIRACRAGGV